MLTFKCHLPGWEDLLAARDPGLIVRERNERETEMERNGRKHKRDQLQEITRNNMQQERKNDLSQTIDRKKFHDLH